MKYWNVSAHWTQPDGAFARLSRTFTSQADAEAFVQSGDPYEGSSPEGRPADPNQVTWEVTPVDLAAEPWVCSLQRGSGFDPAALDLYSQTLLTVQRYYAGICDHFLAFVDCTGTRWEGAITPDVQEALCRGDLYGLQLFKGNRTLFQLDDGREYAFVVDEAIFRDLAALGVQPWQFAPMYAGEIHLT
jgi:hypothetical protein